MIYSLPNPVQSDFQPVVFPAATTPSPGVVANVRPWLLVLIWMLLSWGFSQTTQGQKLVWAKQLSSTNSNLAQVGTSVAVDGVGNVYTTGNFRGTVDFDPGAGVFNLTSAGGDDIFVSKFNTGGNLIWAKQLGGSGDDVGNSVVVDGSGNVYTTGLFYDTVDFDPGAGVLNLTSAGYDDMFVSKLDAGGNLVWVKRIGGISHDGGASIAVDGSGNVYTTGYFLGTTDFDPGAGVFNLTSLGDYDIFMSKLDSGSNFVWAKRVGGTENDEGTSVAVDGMGNVYTTGFFLGTLDFDPGVGVFNLTSAGKNTDVFVSKLDAGGNFVWAKQLGGKYHDGGTSIAVDKLGNVYTTGYFQDTGDFDPGAGVFNMTSAPGAYEDMFVSKLDAGGNFVWAKGVGSTGNDYSTSLAVDGSGNVYTTGLFYYTVDFDPGVGVFNLTAAYSAMFVSKLDAEGNFVWAKQFGGSNDYVFSNSVAVDDGGGVYTIGNFQYTVDFDPGAGVLNLTSVGYRDVFVSKLHQYTPVTLNTWVSSTTVSAGNTLTMSVTATGGTPPYSYTWAAPAGFRLSATNTSEVSASVGARLSGVQAFTITVASSDDSPAVTDQVRVIVNPPPTATFSITGVTTVSCETVTASQYRVTFTPQYEGLDGSPVSFSMVNEMRSTTNQGPYTLTLYTDNPTITLQATQIRTTTEFAYNWLRACTAAARLGVSEEGSGLQVRVLGNPVDSELATIEIIGVMGQPVQIELVDTQGRPYHQQALTQANGLDLVRLPLGNRHGILLIRVSAAAQRYTVKLLRL
ncbi:hypothetical protein GO755_24215 [Spirosoma sp. HMF4905]|uniref:T9SS type A sorting domain-containing protein n=1 Tax=Spirosoma arboris TaxID=2682092 RepID=A0A7K1SHH1_9BACT|nr:SBBP repeat-containing protein [Spirosoma arboris]MVM33168.1 hypothetical protein [Spirosoma arboris]